MNIIINYDFWEHILDAKEELTPFKIIRNNKRKWARFQFPLYTLVDAVVTGDLRATILCLTIQFGGLIGVEYFACKSFDDDAYAKIAKKDLTSLAQKMNDNYVKTSYPLLLDSEYYDRQFKIHFNESKLPEMVEKKYVLVPTYGLDGNINTISIVQNHVVGSKEYVLTVGTPDRKLKPSLAPGV